MQPDSHASSQAINNHRASHQGSWLRIALCIFAPAGLFGAMPNRTVDLRHMVAPAPAAAKPAPRIAWTGKVVSNKDEATARFLQKRVAAGHVLTAVQQSMLDAALARLQESGTPVLPSTAPAPQAETGRLTVKKRGKKRGQKTARAHSKGKGGGTPGRDKRRRRGDVSISAHSPGGLVISLGSTAARPGSRSRRKGEKQQTPGRAGTKKSPKPRPAAKPAPTIEQRLSMSLDAMVARK